MTRTIRTVGLVLVVLCSSVVGGIALGGSAAALDPGAGAVYPSAPGTDALGTAVAVVRPGDAVAQNGIRTITLSTSAGSFANVTDDDVFVAIRGGQRIEISEGGSAITELSNLTVSSSAGGNQLQITLPRPVRPRFASDSPNTGAEVAVKFENFTTPSQPGNYRMNVSLTDPSGTTDGPVSVSYSVSPVTLSMANQSLSQFSDRQTINVSAAIPGGGYVGLFTTAPNGSPGQLVGATNVSRSTSAQNYSIDVGGNISESQQLTAVAYTETSGRSAALRAEEPFNPSEDQPLRVNGTLVNATGYVSTLDVDGRVVAGNQYDQGARLYFPQGEPATGYQLRAVNESELGPAVTQFETATNGTTALDTSDLSEGQYAITRVSNGSLVSLDNDSTTGPQDDSIFITGQQVTTQATATEAATDTATGGDATVTAGGDATTTAGGADTTAVSGSGNANGSGGGNDSGGTDTSSSGGPGFGIAMAMVALVGAALLARRR
jgi:PGF-CTERM protein